MSSISLIDFVATHYATSRELSPESLRQLRMSITQVDRWHGASVRVADLSESLLNAFLVAHGETRSPTTVRRRKGDVLAVWRLAADMGMVDPPRPRVIRKPRVPRRIPDAWTQDELRRLFLEVPRNQNYYPFGIRIGAYWAAWLWIQYSTALRPGDVRRIPYSAIVGQWRQLQHKTGVEKDYEVHPGGHGALEAIRHPDGRELLLPWPYSRTTFEAHWRRYVLGPAAIEPSPRNGPQKMRRTAASWLAREHPGLGSEFLGHQTPGLARRHYIDPRIAESGPRPLPPSPLGDREPEDPRPAVIRFPGA